MLFSIMILRKVLFEANEDAAQKIILIQHSINLIKRNRLVQLFVLQSKR